MRTPHTSHHRPEATSIPSRRSFLRLGAGGLASMTLGAGILTGCKDNVSPPTMATHPASNSANGQATAIQEFYGEHQAGIVTPAQKHIYFIVLDLHTDKREEIKEVFQKWTDYAARLTRGENIAAYGDNRHVPPIDTGEADSLSAYNLTLTFGVSPTFLHKLGLSHMAPAEFVDLPLFPRDQLKPELTGGDICIQSCADDAQVAFHAIRQLVRQARSSVTMRWSQAGFNAFDSGKDTPRNLFGFRDGTANAETLKKADEFIWADSPDWLKGGTYLVARKIQMFLETWDRTSLNGQNDTFGRDKFTGAFMGSQHEFDAGDMNAKNTKGDSVVSDISHSGLAKRSGQQMLRRSYSFASGIDPATGQFDTGLMFVSFQKSPAQFIAVQSALGRIDKMNEYITHVGSGLFACFGGVKQGEYIGQALLEGKKG